MGQSLLLKKITPTCWKAEFLLKMSLKSILNRRMTSGLDIFNDQRLTNTPTTTTVSRFSALFFKSLFHMIFTLTAAERHDAFGSGENVVKSYILIGVPV